MEGSNNNMTKDGKSDSVTLRIVEADVEDVNKGIVRINPLLFSTTVLKENDSVALINARTNARTVAVVKSDLSEEISPNDIKACGALRRYLKAELNDAIIVQKTRVVLAKRIAFTNLNKSVRLTNENALAQKLLDRVVTTRDVLSFLSPKGRIDLQVVEYSPQEAEAVVIRKESRIELVSVGKAK